MRDIFGLKPQYHQHCYPSPTKTLLSKTHFQSENYVIDIQKILAPTTLVEFLFGRINFKIAKVSRCATPV